MAHQRKYSTAEAYSACGSMVRYDHQCAVFPRGARKNRTPTKSSAALSKAKRADRVSRVMIREALIFVFQPFYSRMRFGLGCESAVVGVDDEAESEYGNGAVPLHLIPP